MQHDMVISNATRSEVRQDLNDALQALNSVNSGAVAPTTLVPYMYWMNSSNNRLYQRDSSNAYWIDCSAATLAGMTANQTITTSQNGLIFGGVTSTNGNSYNAATGELTITSPGNYLVSVSLAWNIPGTASTLILDCFLNGVGYKRVGGALTTSSVNILTGQVSMVCNYNDVIQMRALTSGSSVTLLGNSFLTYISFNRL
jgi:hypothetical protein